MNLHTTGKTLLALSLALAAAACAPDASDEEAVGETDDAITVKGSFTSRGTGYYPSSSRLEGGFLDRKDTPLRTLQQFLAGQASYVSVAMDSNAFAYGQRLRIHELDKKYGRSIVFRVVDTGGAFRGKGRSRIDICVKNQSASVDPTINGRLTIDIIDERGGTPAPAPAPSPTPAPGGSSDEADAPAPAPEAGGASCSSDGACNPGNDGSGLICVSGRCTAGCRSNAQCPGVKTCQSGQCR
jgi:3D (Asp-Asp-Asp) domain-containing protein